MIHRHSQCLRFLDNTTPMLLWRSLSYLDTRLSEEIKARILAANIYILLGIGPGSILKVTLNPGETLNRLINIDRTLTEDLLKFDPYEITAEILHELGHYFNHPPTKVNNEEVEFYADDFARRAGCGPYLQKGLEKYITEIERRSDAIKDIYLFKDANKQQQIVDLMRTRIERIKNNSPILQGVTDVT